MQLSLMTVKQSLYTSIKTKKIAISTITLSNNIIIKSSEVIQ